MQRAPPSNMPAARGPPNAEESRVASASLRAAKIGAAKACARKRTTPQRDGGGPRVSSKRRRSTRSLDSGLRRFWPGAKLVGQQVVLVNHITAALGIAPRGTLCDTATAYDGASTETMEKDKDRMLFYERAVAERCKDKVVLDPGAGDNGVLAKMALDAGAKEVIAVDIRPKAVMSMKKHPKLRAHIAQGRLRVFRANMTALNPDRDRELCEALKSVQVCVHEIFGTIASEEGIPQIMQAVRQFATPDMQSVPRCAYTMISPVDIDQLPRDGATDQALEDAVVSRDGGILLGYPSPRNSIQVLLAEPQAGEALDFERPDGVVSGREQTLRFEVMHPGRFNALRLQLKLTSAPRLELWSGDPTSNWPDCYVMIPYEKTRWFAERDRIAVTMRSDYGPAICTWTIAVYREDPGGREVMHETTFDTPCINALQPRA